MPTNPQLDSYEIETPTNKSICNEICKLLDRYPDGLTAVEIAVKLGHWQYPNRQHTAPRLVELKDSEKVVEADKPRLNIQTGKVNTVYLLKKHWETKKAYETAISQAKNNSFSIRIV